jgi:hypothetical protein
MSARGKASIGSFGLVASEGLIEDPVGKQRSVVLTDEGLRKAANCFDKPFARVSRPSITDLPQVMPQPAFNRSASAYSLTGAAGHLSR